MQNKEWKTFFLENIKYSCFRKLLKILHSMFVMKIVCSRGIYCASQKIGLITGQTFAIMPSRLLRLAENMFVLKIVTCTKVYMFTAVFKNNLFFFEPACKDWTNMSISTPIYEIETYFEQSLYFEQINKMKFYIENCCFLPKKKTYLEDGE